MSVRIAVSGTHCSGKSTLVEDFVAAHRDYVHEPEPYEWLQELHGEQSGDEPGAADFYRQLELSVERLRGYGQGARVIAERSPIDFIAYMLALEDLRGERASGLIQSAISLAASAMKHIDLLVILPLNHKDGITAPESEDLDLREAMNDRLLELVTTNEFDLLRSDQPRVIELQGLPAVRLAALEQAVGKSAAP